MTIHCDVIKRLDSVIDTYVSNISLYTKNPNDFIRNRKLSAKTTIKTILSMGDKSLNKELLEAFPDKETRMSAPAFVMQKDKLRPELFRKLLCDFTKTFKPSLFRNKYRLMAIDGSDFNIPFNPKSEYVINSCSKDKKISMLHANTLYDIESKLYMDCIPEPKSVSNERNAARELIKNLDSNCIVIMDRGYDGINMYEHLNRMGVKYLIRTKVHSGGLMLIDKLDDIECDLDFILDVTTSKVEYDRERRDNPYKIFINVPIKSHTENYADKKPRQWDFGRNCKVAFRVVKFKISDDTWEVLVTNLPRNEFNINDLKELYHKRWDIETSFRDLKYSLGTVNFHSNKDDSIFMELFAGMIMYNAVTMSVRQIDIEKSFKIKINMACMLVKQYYRNGKSDYTALCMEIKSYIYTEKKGRQAARNIKPKSAVPFTYR